MPIVEDNPYRDMQYSDETIPSIFSLDQKREGNHVSDETVKRLSICIKSQL